MSDKMEEPVFKVREMVVHRASRQPAVVISVITLPHAGVWYNVSYGFGETTEVPEAVLELMCPRPID